MKENHLQQSDINSTGDIKPERSDHPNARLETAIRVIDLSWTMLSELARDFDIDVEKPEPDNATRRGFFETMKWEALELADGIYWSASDAARCKEDRDLEMFESTGIIVDQASPRLQALALLTFARELVEQR
jgi:hypothetical protein